MSWRATTVRLTCWISGHSRYRFDQQLQANEGLTLEAIEQMQLDKLKGLLGHAYATVPYYRELFEQQKIRPQDIRSLKDYSALPILTKAIVRKHGVEAFRSTSFLPSQLVEVATSGSTGEPFRFLRQREYEEWRMAGWWRAWRWGGWTPGNKIAWLWREYWPQNRIKQLEKQLNWWLTGRQWFNVFDMSEATMDRWIDEFRQFKPSFVHAYPSAIMRFSSHLDARRVTLDGVKAVFTSGEMLLPNQRNLIKQTFQAEVHDMYGSSEVYPIAAECRQGALHLSTDLIVPELEKDPQGSGLKRIIATPLQAYGMPFLRYEVGDLASAITHECSCGLPFPVLEGLVGRATDIFPLPNGRVVHGQILIAYLNAVGGVERFQFRQRQMDLLNLDIIKGAGFSSQAIEAVQKQIQQDLNVRVAIAYVTDIPLTSQGKFRYAVSELGN